MQKSLAPALALLFLGFIAFGQVQVDRPIDLNSATPGNARLMGIKQVSAPQDAVSAEVLQKGSLIHASVTGGPNAYTLTFSPAIGTPYSAGMMVIFIANGDNTAAVTLNAIPLKKDVNIALAPADIKNGQLVTVAYDGTNFQLQSRTTDANSGGTVTNVSVTTANGVSGTVANATTTPAISLTLGAITPGSVAATGTVTGSNLSGTHTGNSSGTNTGDQTLSGLGGVPTTRIVTVNGTAQDLSADRTWNVGTVTNVSTAAANNGVSATWANSTTTPSLTIGLGAITPGSVNASGTVTGSNLSGVNTGDQTLSGLGGVPNTRNITINGTQLNLSADRSWSVGTVTNVTGTAPILSSGGTTPAISISAATGSAEGSMSAADKTKLDAITGTNTGNVTLGAIGAAPNANGATLSGQAFNLEPASAAFGGVLTNGTQSIAGAKTFTGQGTFKSNAGVVNMEGTTHAYIQWYPIGAPAGRKGWTGWGTVGTNDFTIANEISGGDIVIAASGTGLARIAGLGAGIVHANASGQLSSSSVTNAELANSSITVAPSGIGLSVSGSPVSLGGPVTITSNATSANTGSTIVARDASGNFSAATITATLNGKAGLLNYNDIRTLSPNSFTHNAMAFGFTSYNNNNTSPYADFMQLNSYGDASGGNDNLITVSRGSIGMRVWQQTWNSATAFTSYKDVAFQQDAWMKLAEVDVSAVNSTSITGLDGNSYRHFKIFFQGTISTTADRRFLIRPNASTSTYNGFTNFNGSSGGGEFETGGLYVGRSTNSVGGDVEFEYTMNTRTGQKRMGHGLMTFIESTLSHQYDFVSSSYWSDTSTNITSLTLMLNTGGTFTGKIIVMGF